MDPEPKIQKPDQNQRFSKTVFGSDQNIIEENSVAFYLKNNKDNVGKLRRENFLLVVHKITWFY